MWKLIKKNFKQTFISYLAYVHETLRNVARSVYNSYTVQCDNAVFDVLLQEKY